MNETYIAGFAASPIEPGWLIINGNAFVNSQMYISVSVLALLIVFIIAFGLGYFVAKYFNEAK